MTVGEIRRMLADLPDDTPVEVLSDMDEEFDIVGMHPGEGDVYVLDIESSRYKVETA